MAHEAVARPDDRAPAADSPSAVRLAMTLA
jgi:hypothetical protein